jgi:hypothetical protein
MGCGGDSSLSDDAVVENHDVEREAFGLKLVRSFVGWHADLLGFYKNFLRRMIEE